jgi:polyisoprenoid-binding protein YceI
MKWQIDPAHSSLTFGVRHMMVSTVRGTVGGLAGTLEFDPDRPQDARIDVSADPATVTTGEARRDGHLRSADFFDAQAHPTIRFASTAITPQGDDRFEVHGMLEIRGVTKPVTAEAELAGIVDDARAGRRAGFNASFTVDRREWGLVWNQPIANGVLVGDKVRIELGLAATAVAEEAKAA